MSKIAIALLLAFAVARAPYTYHFPRDHAAHDSYRTEWWYFTGHLRARNGHRFGYELTFFRIGLKPHARRLLPGESDWRAAQLYPAHFAITDETARTFVHSQTLAREALGQGFASEKQLDVRANGWTLTGRSENEKFIMHVHAARAGESIALVLSPQKPPAVHGVGGISRKGPCASCASHYYSFTRLASAGTLRSAGVAYRVSGLSWMDHEYGSDELAAGIPGWDWFSIQLDDRREVMLYRLRRTDGSIVTQSSGSIVDARGGVRHLQLSAFSIAATGSWKSPHTQATYPSGWIVRIDGFAHALRLTPVLEDQELADPGGVTYWEGAVAVADARSGGVLGTGYVELTGYAGNVTL